MCTRPFLHVARFFVYKRKLKKKTQVQNNDIHQDKNQHWRAREFIKVMFNGAFFLDEIAILTTYQFSNKLKKKLNEEKIAKLDAN